MSERLKEILIQAAQFSLESTDFAFNLGQKKAIQERDKEHGIKLEGNKNNCQWPYKHNCSGKIHIHHIRPQQYSYFLGVDPDFAENGISICDKVHIGDLGVHPDTAEAKRKFVKGDRDAFEKLQKERKEKLEERTIYWNPTHDRELDIIALRNTQKAEKKGWFWPKKKKK